MKQLITILLFSILFINCSSIKKETLVSSLEPPSNSESNLYIPGEFALLSKRFESVKAKLIKDNQDIKSWGDMLSIYLVQSRVSQDHKYAEYIFDLTTVLLENKSLKSEDQFLLLSYQATALLSLHEFEKGLDVAQKATLLVPQNAAIIGAMVDANVELGNYKEAVALADKMINLRPDIRSYSRVSYLRELYGDIDGAIAAMKEAVASGVPGNEQCEWSRVNLGKLYIKNNKLDFAKMSFLIALENRPNYLPAIEAIANFSLEAGMVAEAKSYVEKGLKISTTTSLLATQCKIAKIEKDEDAYAKYYTQLMKSLDKHSATAPSTKSSKYLVTSKLKENIVDHEMKQIALEKAKFILDLDGDPSQALPYLEFEYKLRPNNIEVNKYMAIALKKMNRDAQAYVLKSELKTQDIAKS